MRRVKRAVGGWYLAFYVAMVVAGLMAVMGIGYYYGPAHFRSRAYEQGIADILLSENNVANIGTFDEGLLQKCYVYGLRERRDVVVLGSSRSMYLRDHLFPGRTFFNSFVSSATIQDYLAVYRLYEERGFIPSTVVIEASPTMLRGQASLRWTSLEDEYSSMAGQLGLAPARTTRIVRFSGGFSELCSWPYFKEALASALRSTVDVGKVEYYATKETSGERSDSGRLYDGSVVDILPYSSEYVEGVVTAQLDGSLVSDVKTTRFTKLSEQRMKELESFVQYLQENSVEVILFLPPYHPRAYDELAEDSAILQAEAYYREMARARGITVVGSYNPQESSCTKEDFLDFHHPMESGVDKVFSMLH